MKFPLIEHVNRICRLLCDMLLDNIKVSVVFNGTENTKNTLWRITRRQSLRQTAQTVLFTTSSSILSLYFIFLDQTKRKTNSQHCDDEQERVGTAQRIC